MFYLGAMVVRGRASVGQSDHKFVTSRSAVGFRKRKSHQWWLRHCNLHVSFYCTTISLYYSTVPSTVYLLLVLNNIFPLPHAPEGSHRAVRI